MVKLFRNIISLFFVLVLVGCVSKLNTKAEDKIKIGVTSIPHGEILKNLKDIFDLDIEIINYIDYEALNNDLVNKKIDGNFFQTREYLENFNNNSGVKLIELAGVHVEPLIIYSSKYKSIDKVEEGDSVYIPNDPINKERALKLLEKAGLIKLTLDFNTQTSTIIENPLNLIISEAPSYELPSLFKEGDLVIMNTNIALENMIFPEENGLYYEDSFNDESKVNVFVTREDMRTSIKLKEIANLLTSYETFKFINEKYKGFVKPIF